VTPRRWSQKTRVWAYRYLAERDGEQCAICHAPPTVPIVTTPTPTKATTRNDSRSVKATTRNDPRLTKATTRNNHNTTLDIDHIDGDPSNDEPDNLRLLCRRCNIITPPQPRSAAARRSDLCVCVRESKEGKPGTRIVRDDVDYRRASPEMQANLVCEDRFRRWLLATITAQGFYYRTAAINEGAELVGCSPVTTARYLAKLTSRSGPISETKDALSHTVLMLKPHLQTRRRKRSQRGNARP
jgi:hypothetical protein